MDAIHENQIPLGMFVLRLHALITRIISTQDFEPVKGAVVNKYIKALNVPGNPPGHGDREWQNGHSGGGRCRVHLRCSCNPAKWG